MLKSFARDGCICFLDLKDGRSVGFIMMRWREPAEDGGDTWKHEWWVVVGRPEPGLDEYYNKPGEIFLPEKTVVIATSLSQFFTRVQQAEGRYYFDNPDFVPDKPLVSRIHSTEEEEDL